MDHGLNSVSLFAAKLLSDDEFLKVFRTKANHSKPSELARELSSLRLDPSLLKRCVACIGPEKRDDFLVRYLDELDAKAPGDVALFVRAFPLPELNPKVQAKVLASGFRYSPQAVEEWAAALPPSARVAVLNEAFGNIIADSRATEEYIRLVPAESFTELTASKALSRLAESSPEDALRLAKSCAPAIRDFVLAEVYSVVLIDRKVADANDLVALMEGVPTPSRAVLAGWLLHASGADLPSCRELLSSLPPQERRGAEAELLRQSSFALSDRQVLLKQWVASGGLFQDVGPGMASSVEAGVKQIAYQTVLSSPTDAIALVQDLPEGEAKVAATRGLAEVVGFYNPNVLFPLLAVLPEGSARDVAIGELARSAVDDPARALDIATAISDPKARGAAFGFIAGAWSNVDQKLVQKLIDERKTSSAAPPDSSPRSGK